MGELSVGYHRQWDVREHNSERNREPDKKVNGRIGLDSGGWWAAESQHGRIGQSIWGWKWRYTCKKWIYVKNAVCDVLGETGCHLYVGNMEGLHSLYPVRPQLSCSFGEGMWMLVGGHHGGEDRRLWGALLIHGQSCESICSRCPTTLVFTLHCPMVDIKARLAFRSQAPPPLQYQIHPHQHYRREWQLSRDCGVCVHCAGGVDQSEHREGGCEWDDGLYWMGVEVHREEDFILRSHHDLHHVWEMGISYPWLLHCWTCQTVVSEVGGVWASGGGGVSAYWVFGDGGGNLCPSLGFSCPPTVQSFDPLFAKPAPKSLPAEANRPAVHFGECFSSVHQRVDKLQGGNPSAYKASASQRWPIDPPLWVWAGGWYGQT